MTSSKARADSSTYILQPDFPKAALPPPSSPSSACFCQPANLDPVYQVPRPPPHLRRRHQKDPLARGGERKCGHTGMDGWTGPTAFLGEYPPSPAQPCATVPLPLPAPGGKRGLENPIFLWEGGRGGRGQDNFFLHFLFSAYVFPPLSPPKKNE